MPEINDPYDARPMRLCMGCGKRDAAPRDQVTLQDGNVALYHWDCHVLISNCEVCKKALEALGTSEENDGVVDQKLHERLIAELSKPLEEQAEIFRTDEAVPQPRPAGAE